MIDPNTYLTTRQAAALLEISPSALLRMRARGEIAATLTNLGYVYRLEDVLSECTDAITVGVSAFVSSLPADEDGWRDIHGLPDRFWPRPPYEVREK